MIREFKGKKPFIHDTAIVDESAIIMGNVFVGKNASIWPDVLIRADDEPVFIEEGACIMDKAFIEAPSEVFIGKGSVISHGATVHGSRIGENVMVGIGAIVLEVEVGKNSIIGAGSVVNKNVDENSFFAGVPAKKIRELKEEEIKRTKQIAREIMEKASHLKNIKFKMD
ncbi:MAG TPA: gamma carbonic anhydrase family protein [Thermoplasmatales archaeon]|nr:gamma carbonic anhydrase family protein [Thermoplasmatales archaeon]